MEGQTFLVDGHPILDLLGAHGEAVRFEEEALVQNECKSQRETYLRVLMVSWRKFRPGARLQMSRPTLDPPSVSIVAST